MRKLMITALVCFCCNVNAETIKLDLKTGLWENTFKMTGNAKNEIKALQTEQMKKAMEEMKKQMANMPPEQRKQMEAIMAQSGMSMGDGAELGSQVEKMLNQGANNKQCIVDTEFDPKDFMDAEEGDNCKSTMTQVSKNKIHSAQVCTGENASQHEMDVVFDSPKHYTGTGFATQSVDGKVHKIEMVLEGTWVSSDCGTVKPVHK